MLCALRTLDGSRHAASTVISGSKPIDLHAELDRGVGDQAADRAEADDAERAVRQLDAGELLLAVLDPRLEVAARGHRARAT